MEDNLSVDEIRQRRLNRILSQQTTQPQTNESIESEKNETKILDKTSEVLPMDIGEPLRTDKMEVDENPQISKRKTSTELPMSEKNENSQSIKPLNELQIIEAIFQVKIQPDTDCKAVNSIFSVLVDPIFLNYQVYFKDLIQEILFNVITNIDQEYLSTILNNRSLNFILDSFKNINIQFTTQSIALKYLIDSYNLLFKSSKSDQQSNKEFLENIYQECRFQILRNIILVLNGHFHKNTYSLTESQLVPFLMANYVSTDLLIQLIIESSKTASTFLNGSVQFRNDFAAIFTPVINSLSRKMNFNSLAMNESEYMAPMYVLRELCTIKIDQGNPICNLIVEMDNWTISGEQNDQKNGKIVAVSSVLGPYFKLSLFAEDDAKVAERYFKRDLDAELTNETLTLISKQVQPILASTRAELLKIVKTLIYNKQSRKQMVNFLKLNIKCNYKRSNIQTNESIVCGDGYMLNLLFVLHELARPIVKDKVELLVIYDSKMSPVQVMDDESKLNCDKEKFIEFTKSIAEKFVQEPSFTSEIFFLTMNCHHISIISIINKYMRRVRVIRELNKNVEELKKTENNWKNTPLATRYRKVIQRFQTKVKIDFGNLTEPLILMGQVVMHGEPSNVYLEM